LQARSFEQPRRDKARHIMACGKHVEANLCRVVKNTFIELPVRSDSQHGLRRTHSDSALLLRTGGSPTVSLSEEVLNSCRGITKSASSTKSPSSASAPSEARRARWADDLSDSDDEDTICRPPMKLQLHSLLPEPEVDLSRHEQSRQHDFTGDCTGMLPMMQCADFAEFDFEAMAEMFKADAMLESIGFYNSACSTPEVCDDSLWGAHHSDFSSNRLEDSEEEERDVQSGTLLVGSPATAVAADDAAPGVAAGMFAAWQESQGLSKWAMEPKENSPSAELMQDAFGHACAVAEQHQMSIDASAEDMQWLYSSEFWAMQGWDEMSACDPAWYIAC